MASWSRRATIAVVGGTGTLGRKVAAELRSRGHEVRVLSRSAPEYPVDLDSGAGLGPALAGCAVVVDASNNSSRHAARTLVDGTRRLLRAEQEAGVAQHVCVSVVGCDQVPMSYFRVKTEQERVVEHGPVPWTIVRATQFHEFIAAALNATRSWPMIPVPRARLQTVASAEVARAVADVADGVPLKRRIEVAGPERSELHTFVRAWRSAAGSSALLVPVPLPPGRLGKVLRAGALTAAQPDVRGTTTFSGWLRHEH